MREAPSYGRYTPADESPSRARRCPVLVRRHCGRRRGGARPARSAMARTTAASPAAFTEIVRGARLPDSLPIEVIVVLSAPSVADAPTGDTGRSVAGRAVPARRDRRRPRRGHPAARASDLPQRAERLLRLRSARRHRPTAVDRRGRRRVPGAPRVPGRRRRELARRARLRRAPPGPRPRRHRQGRVAWRCSTARSTPRHPYLAGATPDPVERGHRPAAARTTRPLTRRATRPTWPASSPAPAAPPASAASRRARRSCRSRSWRWIAACSWARRPRCSRASTARSTRTATATSPTTRQVIVAPVSEPFAAFGDTPEALAADGRGRRPARWSSPPPATTARPARASARSRRPASAASWLAVGASDGRSTLPAVSVDALDRRPDAVARGAFRWPACSRRSPDSAADVADLAGPTQSDPTRPVGQSGERRRAGRLPDADGASLVDRQGRADPARRRRDRPAGRRCRRRRRQGRAAVRRRPDRERRARPRRSRADPGGRCCPAPPAALAREGVRRGRRRDRHVRRLDRPRERERWRRCGLLVDAASATAALLKPDLVAPGVAITSSLAGGGYGAVTGTSAAAAQVAGDAAVLLEAHPTWTRRRCCAARSSARRSVNGHDARDRRRARSGRGPGRRRGRPRRGRARRRSRRRRRA